MIWLALLIILFGITVARVRQQGIPWEDIIAVVSQWVHFMIMGGAWGPTLSSCIGFHVRERHKYRFVWKALEIITDAIFWFKEYDHCAESLHRVEKLERQSWTSTQYSEAVKKT